MSDLENFEIWGRNCDLSLERDGVEYKSETTELCWQAWMCTEPTRISLEYERDNLVEALREMAEKIRRCDYTQARSDALSILAKYPVQS